MAAAAVSCRVWLTHEPVEVGVLVANNNSKTQISRRLAKKLGLTYTQDIYVRDAMGMFRGIKWKNIVTTANHYLSCVEDSMCFLSNNKRRTGRCIL